MPDDGFKRPKKRRHVQACGPAMDTIGHSRVVALAKGEIHVRIGNRVAETGQDLMSVRPDIAIMEGNDLGLTLRKEITVSQPTGAALSLGARLQPVRFKGLKEPGDPR